MLGKFMGEVSSASTLAAALSRFLALNTRCPVTWDKTAEKMAHISTLPVDLFHMATESTRSIVSTEEEDAPAGMAGAGGPVELSEENIAALNKGAFRPPDPELKSSGNKGRILRSSSRQHTATTPPQASDLATPYSAAKRSGSATIANLDLTCISQVQPSGYTRKTVSKKTWKTAAKSKLSMDMRDTPFGSDFEIDAVTSLEVASKFVGSFGAKLPDELSFACDLLNTVSVRLIEHGYHERRDGFLESGFELIALALHQGLAKAMSDSKCRFRSVLLNKKNLNFAVPTLMVQFGNGILATGHGDIGTFALVGDDVDVVEFMACTSEMKSEINGTFLGQTGAEMLAFDGLQTPGQLFRVDDIADRGAHMCAGMLLTGATGVGLTHLGVDGVSEAGFPQHKFFIEVAGNLPEGADAALADNAQQGVYHLVALQLLRTRLRVSNFDVVASPPSDGGELRFTSDVHSEGEDQEGAPKEGGGAEGGGGVDGGRGRGRREGARKERGGAKGGEGALNESGASPEDRSSSNQPPSEPSVPPPAQIDDAVVANDRASVSVAGLAPPPVSACGADADGALVLPGTTSSHSRAQSVPKLTVRNMNVARVPKSDKSGWMSAEGSLRLRVKAWSQATGM
jgi:hypothetical protein